MDRNVVRFGGTSMAGLSVLGGVAVCIGVPLIVVAYGTALGVAAQVGITILALIVGGGIALVGAFFGTVIPREVSTGNRKDDADKESDESEAK